MYVLNIHPQYNPVTPNLDHYMNQGNRSWPYIHYQIVHIAGGCHSCRKVSKVSDILMQRKVFL